MQDHFDDLISQRPSGPSLPMLPATSPPALYTALQEEDEIRLLHLNPGTESTPITCTLQHARLSQIPAYEALSYQGPEFPLQTIELDGQPRQVRANLHSALQHLRLDSVISALFHPIFRWAFPDFNVMLVRSMHNVYKEFKRGRPNQGGPREVAGFGVGVDEDTPLTGRGFSRMNSRAYVEIPGYSGKGL
ncbi:uncharacterized protein K444DRAFT_616629 [Hyaloscypha bicolor E]|jgi:hypothetical protein|uniref:Uncharacterized protein n=1 Tax=Hyaloscypha bicolor E TaxID=1095630 RepID=A0A2J6SXU0_9HELO|nr:uncharacterized protein K444DRAFT_616629 [Hyaloscypha bicolor E]PMD55589.1 hypothetical protein K444DRAFT_616629 [Hyaloscypha bicolor E]